MADHAAAIVLEEETDPVEKARARIRRERFERNWAWLEAHAQEVYSQRGKVIGIAGEELFVGDTTEEVLAWAKAVHPDDDGLVTRIIPKERGARIYAH
jgi:hypothetical protein